MHGLQFFLVWLSITSTLINTVNALSFPIHAFPRTPSMPKKFIKRLDVNGAFGNGSILVSDAQDLAYFANLTLGGAEWMVQIDTGSSDLYVAGTVPQTQSLGISADLQFGGNDVTGTINVANLNFDDYSIPNQAYILTEPDQNTPTGQGLIGLGPNSNSVVLAEMVNASSTQNGQPPIYRIFEQNTTTANFISVLLSRGTDDGSEQSAPNGQMTVGEVIPGFESITSQTKLDVPAQDGGFSVAHWQTLLDANGIIGPDGKQINTQSSLSVSNQDQLRVVFDTGFSLPQVQSYIADAIYGRIPGAQLKNNADGSAFYQIPCNYELNVSFVFGGAHIPIAPLDLSLINGEDSDGQPVCQSTFQQTQANVANHDAFGGFDLILGMAFLRNVYLLVDVGDFVNDDISTTNPPYIQLLSTTDPASAHQAFINARLGGKDTTGSQPALLPPGTTQQPSTPTNNTSPSTSKPFYKQTWFLITAISAGSVILLSILFSFIRGCLSRRQSRVRNESAFIPMMTGPGSYRPLQNPNSRIPGYPPL